MPMKRSEKEGLGAQRVTMHTADPAIYEFGQFRLDSGRRELTDVAGRRVPLPGRVFDTLLCLLEHRQRLVSKEDLMAEVWPDVVVEQNNLNQAISSVRRLLEDDARAPRFVKTVPGRGYQFIATVRERPLTAAPRASLGRSSLRRYGLLLSAAVLVWAAALIGLVRLSYAPQPPPPLAANGVAVLPFANLSPNEADAFFAQGLHDEVIHQLSLISDLKVIARTSVLGFAPPKDRAQPSSVAEIAQSLGVANVIEGSVRYADGHVRITVQLIDARDQSHLWSQTYTQPFDDIFAVESDIARQVASALSAKLTHREDAVMNRRPTDSARAYIAYLRARSILNDPNPATSEARSHRFQSALDEALVLDPDFALAHAMKALDFATALMRPYATRNGERERLTRLAQAHIDRALALDASLGAAYGAQARLCEATYDSQRAAAAYRRAYELSPRSSNVLIDYASFAYRRGNWPLTRRLIDVLAVVDPEVPVLGVHYLLLSQPAKARAHLGQSLKRRPLAGPLYHWLAMAMLAEGEVEGARSTLRLGLDVAAHADAVSAATLAHFVYALGRAGMDAAAQAEYDRLLNHSPVSLVRALGALGIGDENAALAHLRTAAAHRHERDFAMQFRIKHNVFDDDRLEQPEFVELRRRLGFPDP